MIAFAAAACGAVAVLLLLIAFFNTWFLKSKVGKMPGISMWAPTLPFFTRFSHPLVQDFQKIYNRFGEFTEKLGGSVTNATTKNDIMRITRWWYGNEIVVQNAELVKQICVQKVKQFPKDRKVYSLFEILGKSILTTNGEEWRKHRTLCNPAFSDEFLKHLCSLTVDSTKRLFEKYSRRQDTKEGTSSDIQIDVFNDMAAITFDVIGKGGFGYDMGIWNGTQDEFDSSKFTMSFKQALDTCVGDGMMHRFMYANWIRDLPIAAFQKVKRAQQEAEQYIRQVIAQRKEQSGAEQGHDLLSLLMTTNDGELGVLSEQEVISNSFIFLFAGHETTSTQLSWTLYRLAKHQDVQEKLIQEVDAVLRGREPTFDDYRSLKYLNCVVKESLRMHPPIPRFGRMTDADVMFGKYTVPAGTGIIVNTYSLHHDDRYWDQPNEFNPDRFDTSINPSGVKHTYAYIPFSIGNRNCIGQSFSLIESCMILATLIQQYTIEFVPGTPSLDYAPEPLSTIVTVRPSDYSLLLKKRVQ